MHPKKQNAITSTKKDDLLDVPDVDLHLQVLDLHPVLLLGKLSDALDNHVPQAALVGPTGFAQDLHGVLPIHHRVPEDHPHRHQPCALVVAHRGNIDIAHSWERNSSSVIPKLKFSFLNVLDKT